MSEEGLLIAQVGVLGELGILEELRPSEQEIYTSALVSVCKGHGGRRERTFTRYRDTSERDEEKSG